MSRPTAVEGSTPGYRPITNHPDWALAFFGFVVPRTFAAHPLQHGLVEEGVLGELTARCKPMLRSDEPPS